jgi:hypothetical protein
VARSCCQPFGVPSTTSVRSPNLESDILQRARAHLIR